MFRFAATIFLSAFLLFQVQPLIAKYILPWFGGSPAVWTTCMLFFQVLLLAGYAYAHLTSTVLGLRGQVILHVALLAGSLAILPIIPSEVWKPEGTEDPARQILLLLAATVGVPYVLLATTGPLVQRWFSRAYPGLSPYRLYALSNVGSLLALVSYPVLVEPFFQVGHQAVAWSIGYGVFALACSWCAWTTFTAREVPTESADEAPASDAAAPVLRDTMSSADEDAPSWAAPDPALMASSALAPPRKPSWLDLVMWLGLATFPSIMLLATTNQVCQEVAVVPFLWVLPLSLYLISFILCFDSPRWYDRRVWGTMLLVWIAAATGCLIAGVSVPLIVQVIVFSLALFSCCMTCHGELARSKPDPRYLTLFYLMMSAGGALGGAFVVVIAPIIFHHYWELHFGLAMCLILSLFAYFRARDRRGMRSSWTWGVAVLLVVTLILVLVLHARHDDDRVIARVRSFYGVMTVTKSKTKEGETYTLRHGRIQHGFQYQDPEKARMRTSYYATPSGIGVAIDHHPKRGPQGQGPLRIGVIGLGTGTLAVYGKPGDTIRFYEINPEVERLANEYFSYCKDSEAEVSVVLGDARVKMEQELREGHPQRFDVLAIDAFSSDAIPMHLLTRECFEVYWQHLAEDGVLAVHISNRYLNLQPVVRGLADEAGYTAVLFDWDNIDGDPSLDSCDWVLVTRNEKFLNSAAVGKFRSRWPRSMSSLVWTDDYGSLLQVLD